MEVIGKTTINPVLFYSGKLSGYFTWIVLGSSLVKIQIISAKNYFYNESVAIVILIIGMIALIMSLINLGNATRLGLPSAETKLKTRGIYTLSRNPMYLGMDLITAAAILYTLNLFIFLLGVYSILIYHYIILGEEKFLEHRFGQSYLDFKKRVRRYL